MSLLDVLRSGVEVANQVTRPLQPTVSYRRFVSADGEGDRTYDPNPPAAATSLHAIVDWKQRQVRTTSGELSVTRATVTLLDIAEVVAATAGEGIGDDDLFVLPDGTTGPILDLGGFIDAGTGHPIATEVMLG